MSDHGFTFWPPIVQQIAPAGETPGVGEIQIFGTKMTLGQSGFESKTITHSLGLSNITPIETFTVPTFYGSNFVTSIWSYSCKRGAASAVVQVEMIPIHHNNWNFHSWTLLGAVKDIVGTDGLETNQITFGAFGQPSSNMSILCRMTYREGVDQTITYIA